MFRLITSALLAPATGVFAWPPGHHGGPWLHNNPAVAQQKWSLKNFTSLVIFGDSYSDDSRLAYFSNNDGAPPPVGYVNPANYDASTGGRVWPQYIAQYSGANIYNYAVSGAVCSNDITPRYYATIDAPFPDIAGYEVPAYIADSGYTYANGTKFLIEPQDETVYAIWIGTNDLGYQAFIEDEQVPGTDLTTYLDCVYDQLSRVYDNGGRYFVIMNVAPLNLGPEYGIPGLGGVGPNKYWPDKGDAVGGNLTEISGRMLEQVVTVNAVYDYRTPFEVEIAKRYSGASFAVYDVHGLVSSSTPISLHSPTLVRIHGRFPC